MKEEMTPEKFKALYQGEWETTWPKSGYQYVVNHNHAVRESYLLGMSTRDWTFIRNKDQLQGIEIPSKTRFYFISDEIPFEFLQTRLRA